MKLNIKDSTTTNFTCTKHWWWKRISNFKSIWIKYFILDYIFKDLGFKIWYQEFGLRNIFGFDVNKWSKYICEILLKGVAKKEKNLLNFSSSSCISPPWYWSFDMRYDESVLKIHVFATPLSLSSNILQHLFYSVLKFLWMLAWGHSNSIRDYFQ